MFLIILASGYFLLGGLLAGALLTDKHCNTNKKEAFFCFVAGLVWPLAVGTAAGFGLFENVREKIYARRQLRNEKVLRFANQLVKMKLITKDTYHAVSKRMKA